MHTGASLFIVINELRETVGIISLHDIVKALFGRNLTDEFKSYDDIREVAAKTSLKSRL